VKQESKIVVAFTSGLRQTFHVTGDQFRIVQDYTFSAKQPCVAFTHSKGLTFLYYASIAYITFED